MSNKFDRTKRLLGADAMTKLSQAHVAVFGIGGVGGHAVDALVRSGVGEITIVDSDDVAESNINDIAIVRKIKLVFCLWQKETVVDMNYHLWIYFQ